MGQARGAALPRAKETSHRTCCQSMRNLLQMLVSCGSLLFPEQCGDLKREKEKIIKQGNHLLYAADSLIIIIISDNVRYC